MKLYRVVTTACVCIAWTGGAQARKPGPMDQGTWIVGAEHLTGVYHTSTSITPDGASSETANSTTIAFLGHAEADLLIAPRLSVDAFPIDGLSLGGSFTVHHGAVSFNGNGSVATAISSEEETAFLIAPRIGYAYMFTDVIGLWPRGGLTYAHLSDTPDSGAGGTSKHLFAFDLDATLVIAPVQNFAVTAGVAFDATFGGKQSVDVGSGLPSANAAISETAIGLTTGIAGLF